MPKEKVPDRYEVVEVPTQTEKYISDADQKDENDRPVLLDVHQALKKIMNDIEELKRGLL